MLSSPLQPAAQLAPNGNHVRNNKLFATLPDDHRRLLANTALSSNDQQQHDSADIIVEVANSARRRLCRDEVVCEVLQALLQRSPAASHNIRHSDSPFWLLDVGRTRQLMAQWNAAFPRVRPFYAVKCNGDPLFLRTLASVHAGFDCASKEELQQVSRLGISPDRIVFANPCKLESDMTLAAMAGVHLTTFDSEVELRKIKRFMDPTKAKLLLRIFTNDEGATIPLSSKYGARMEEVPALLKSAGAAGLAVVGVSFHVGSGANNPGAFKEAIANARRVFDMAEELLGSEGKMHLLDIGGGFCSSGPESEEGYTGGGVRAQDAGPVISKELERHFPEENMKKECHESGGSGCTGHCRPAAGGSTELKIIAEPGRYFACAPFTLVARIFGKRVRAGAGESSVLREYWITDGAHGSFTMILLPHNTRVPKPIPFACTSQPNNMSCKGMTRYPSNVFGPTCSALDTVLKGVPLPELEMGDLLAFPFMGAYTNSLATGFNGFSVSRIPVYGFLVTDYQD